MANALDDLRYISRYGYRDPWAEASKNITDSLLAYADSKNRRDTLLAKYKSDQEQLEYDRGKDDRDFFLDVYQDATAAGKLSLIEDEKNAKYFPSGLLESEIKTNTGIVAYETDRNKHFDIIKDSTTVTPEVIQSIRWLERNVPGDATGTRARVTNIKTGVMSQHKTEQDTKYITDTSDKYYQKGLLDGGQRTAVKDALAAGDFANADKLLKQGLESNRRTAEDIEEYYNDQKAMIINMGKTYHTEADAKEKINQLEKELRPFFPEWIQNQRDENNQRLPFTTMMGLMKLGKAKGVDDKTASRLNNLPAVKQRRAFLENLGGQLMNTSRDSSITEPDGTVTKTNVSEFHTDSDGRFALPEEEFAMPPESQVELQYKNGTTKIVTGENAWEQIQRGDVTYANSNKSGMYLKIGVGSNPVLAEKAGSRIPGVFEGDWAGGEVGIVYQNPSKRQYKGGWQDYGEPMRTPGIGTVKGRYSGKLSDTAFSTRNIKLQNGDLLIDTDTGSYHRVTILEPPKGTPLKWTATDKEFAEREIDRQTPTDALEKTIFRVNGKDYTSTQLTKKFMVPMTVPNTNQSQPEQVDERTEPKLISMTPFDADSAWVADSTTWMEPAVEADTTYK